MRYEVFLYNDIMNLVINTYVISINSNQGDKKKNTDLSNKF